MRLILMDGECSFCQASTKFIMKRDRGTFHFASLQSEIGQHYIEHFQLTEVDSVVLVEEGKAYIYSDAALRIAANLNGIWRLLWLARYVPKRLRDAIYRMIAKNRHYILKKESVCSIPTEKDRARFLS